MDEQNQMNRKAFLAKAGAGTVAAASLPALLGAQAALADASNGHHVYVFVSFSQAPPSGGVTPRIGMQGAGTFDPQAGWVKGGGNYVLFDQASSTPKTLLASGLWEPTGFVSYTDSFGTYGTIQPAILEMTADLEGFTSGKTLRLICNVGPAGITTGQTEGWKLFGTPDGDFLPLPDAGAGAILGITHLSIEGISIDRGA